MTAANPDDADGAKLYSAIGIVMDLMDHIGSRVSVTRHAGLDMHYDDDGRLTLTTHRQTTTGELFDVRTTTPAGRVVEVTFADTRTVLLPETEPYTFTCHTCPNCPGHRYANQPRYPGDAGHRHAGALR